MYYVIELQTNADGTSGNFVFQFDTLPEAYTKFYTVLTFAAQSQVLVHSALLVDRAANVIERKSFTHPVPDENA